METRSVVLVKSGDLGWSAIEAALRSVPGMAVVGEAREAGRALGLVEARRPDAVVSAAIVGGAAMRPLLLGLRRGACPGLTVVLLGEAPPGDEAEANGGAIVNAHLLWTGLSEATLGPLLACALSGEVILAAPPLVEAFVRGRSAGGRRQAVAVPDRERAVLRRLAAGGTRREIAAATGLSLRTVGRVMDRLGDKLGTTGACALVGKAAALGLLADDDDGETW